MKEEAKGLLSLFRDDYGLGVEEFIIPANERATISFNAFLPAQIIKHEDEKGDNKLLILYYGGHGHWDRRSNKHYWKPVQDRSHTLSDVSMPLTTMRENLQLVTCDLLLLFDCCYSLAMMGEDFVGKRRAWLLAAAGNVERASGTPGNTWTAAITKELKQLKDSGGVSASQLNDILTRSEKVLRTYKLTATPFIRCYSAPSFLSDIFIEVIEKQSKGNEVSGGTKQPEKLQTDARMLIKIAFRNPADELKQSLWEYWFATRPPNFSEVEFAILKQIEVVDLFQANSCVLLVTMPVSLWAFFPPHPAYDCIDMVRSRKDLFLDRPGDAQTGQQSLNTVLARSQGLEENVINPTSGERWRLDSGREKRKDTTPKRTLHFQWRSRPGGKESSLSRSFFQNPSPGEVPDLIESRIGKSNWILQFT